MSNGEHRRECKGPILAPLTDWERELLVRYTQDAPGTPRYTTADENASTDDGQER
jgi:hypothetical protein